MIVSVYPAPGNSPPRPVRTDQAPVRPGADDRTVARSAPTRPHLFMPQRVGRRHEIPARHRASPQYLRRILTQPRPLVQPVADPLCVQITQQHNHRAAGAQCVHHRQQLPHAVRGVALRTVLISLHPFRRRDSIVCYHSNRPVRRGEFRRHRPAVVRLQDASHLSVRPVFCPHEHHLVRVGRPPPCIARNHLHRELYHLIF